MIQSHLNGVFYTPGFVQGETEGTCLLPTSK